MLPARIKTRLGTQGAAKYETVLEAGSWRRCGVGDGLVLIGPVKRFQPCNGMKDRRAWMRCDQFCPSGILEGLNLVDHYTPIALAVRARCVYQRPASLKDTTPVQVPSVLVIMSVVPESRVGR